MIEAISISSQYLILKDIIYLRASGIDLTLDVYVPRESIDPITGLIKDATKALPTVVFFHGGGWVAGNKEESALQLLPYLTKGWCVVNVTYRLGPDALAPAAVEDARSAVWWVKRNCAQYGFDADRIILTGQSAGGHLALMAGVLPSDAGFDTQSPHLTNPDNRRFIANASLPNLEVAAIINWAGVSDVNDLVREPNLKSYALQWLGGAPDLESRAKRVSPLNYIREGLPPILTLHGDQDVIVPYDHSVRLHADLDRFNVENQLYTIKGKEHFDFSLDDSLDAYRVIYKFLDDYI